MNKPHTWTKSEWHTYWGKCNKRLRDFLWGIMVDTHKRMMAERKPKAKK